MDNKYNVLTDQELIQIAHEGSETATEILIKKYDELVRYIANSYFSKIDRAIIDEDVVVQDGRLGLLNAIRSFDDEKEAGFKTYASRCISNSIINSLKKSTNINMNLKSLDEEDFMYQVASEYSTEEDVLLNDLFNSLISKESKVFSEFEKTVLGELIRGNGYKEIAKKLDKTPKSIDNTIQRIKKKMSVYINK